MDIFWPAYGDGEIPESNLHNVTYIWIYLNHMIYTFLIIQKPVFNQSEFMKLNQHPSFPMIERDILYLDISLECDLTLTTYMSEICHLILSSGSWEHCNVMLYTCIWSNRNDIEHTLVLNKHIILKPDNIYHKITLKRFTFII